MKRPDIRRLVGVCTSCRNWQIDVRSGAVSDLGGQQAAIAVVAEAASEHLHNECAGGPNGRANILGRWVDQPTMASGRRATGSLEMNPAPAWWVAR